jgi:hypothetical protein
MPKGIYNHREYPKMGFQKGHKLNLGNKHTLGYRHTGKAKRMISKHNPR